MRRAPVPVLAAVAFGSNVGDRERHVATALARLEREPGVRVMARSAIRETAPEGGPPQGRYLNGVVLLETTLSPRELLDRLRAIEQAGGRVRFERNDPRTIDLDLVFHGDAAFAEPGLQVPHPRAHLRAFVLEPLAEVAPRWRHPAFQRTARELWDAWRAEHAAR